MATASTMTSAAMPTPTATQTLTESSSASSLFVTVPDCDTDTDNWAGVDIVTVGRCMPLCRTVQDIRVLSDAGGGCVVSAMVDVNSDFISTINTHTQQLQHPLHSTHLLSTLSVIITQHGLLHTYVHCHASSHWQWRRHFNLNFDNNTTSINNNCTKSASLTILLPILDYVMVTIIVL